MTRENIIKALHEALDSVDITFPYRYVFVEAIEAISQPSLPSNLDEAAENYAHSLGYDEEKDKAEIAGAKEDFVAGAEWMAEQAEKDIIDRACEWLFSHLPILLDYYDEDIHEKADRSEFIKLFRTQMEEEQ